MPYQYNFSQTDEATKKKVWEKGTAVEGYDAAVWRRDICGKVMKYSEHGNVDSEYGWEIDHIKPLSANGTNTWDNLQPLNWKVNRAKSDTYPWSCSMLD
ncbi:HNH endonuclease signature motif containing protein [Prosthecobacter sp.]|uniref:HNH endonuclease signature motif containing protein n=1 Tax=Prosthecobacter sp. TaxID=1965333 RepID=UPI0037846E56